MPESTCGKLYIIATPIGNLGDMSYRAVETLRSVSLIAAEDTRNSIRLLNHFDIHTPMTSYHEYNRIEKGHHLVSLLLEGKNIALITDAGTPGISDPGEDLVRMCRDAGIPVTSVPGACACVNALIISGRPTRRFCFEAFLPADKKDRRRVLREIQEETRTTVIYEAPHRLRKTLQELLEVLGDRRLSICRELTKKFETVMETTLEDAVRFYGEQEPRGEYVLVLEGRSHASIDEEERSRFENMSVQEHVEMYEEQGLNRKDAMKQAAKDRGVSKRDIYRSLLEEDGGMK